MQKAYIPLTDKLDRVIELMKDMQADWLKRENDRIAAEKAEAARIARKRLMKPPANWPPQRPATMYLV